MNELLGFLDRRSSNHSLLPASGNHDLLSLQAVVTDSFDIPVKLIRCLTNE